MSLEPQLAKPIFILIDIRELLKLTNVYPKLFVNFPIRELIQLLLMLPLGINTEEFIDEELRSRFSAQELADIDMDLIDIIISCVDDEIYKVVSRTNIDIENNTYMFYSWVDEFTLLLAREDKIFDGVSSSELYTKFKNSKSLPVARSNSRYRYRFRQ